MLDLNNNTAYPYENAVYTLSQTLFANILKRDAEDTGTWDKRIKTLEANGLLTFIAESPFKPAALNVDESRLEDPRYRRFLIRKLKAPRPSKFMSHRLTVKREEISNPSYVADISKLLAYKWTVKLLPVESLCDKLVLLKLDERSLTRALDTMRMHESDGPNVAALTMRMMVDDILDGNEKMQACLAELKAGTAEVVRDFEASIKAFTAPLLEESRAKIAAITAESCAALDAAQEKICKDLAESAARSNQTMDECSLDSDRDAWWEKAMAEAERKRKEANKLSPRMRWFLGILGLTIGTLLAFHLEVNGVTPVEFIDWLIR